MVGFECARRCARTRRRASPLRIQCLSCKHGEEKERERESCPIWNHAVGKNGEHLRLARSDRSLPADFLTFSPFFLVIRNASRRNRLPGEYTRRTKSCRVSAQSSRPRQSFLPLSKQKKDSRTLPRIRFVRISLVFRFPGRG